MGGPDKVESQTFSPQCGNLRGTVTKLLPHSARDAGLILAIGVLCGHYTVIVWVSSHIPKTSRSVG